MGSGRSEKLMVVTQVSVGGFDKYTTAKMLLDYFEENVGAVLRCRLKTSSTPTESYPCFEIDVGNIQKMDDYEKVEPHAFLHFAIPKAVNSALNAAGRGDLVYIGKPLKVSLGPQNSYRMNQMRRTTIPFKLSNVQVEVGCMRNLQFFVGWRGPSEGVNFLVDSFDGTCKLLFSMDTAFSLKGTRKYAVIKCNMKVEFLVREIKEIKKYEDIDSLVMVLQLASSPLVYYRTADDDIEESYPFDLLDDDDPWIRTVDFTRSGAIGRCNTFKISIPPRNGPHLRKTINYLKERRVPVSDDGYKTRLRSRDEPEFGVPLQDAFFSIHYKQDIHFNILFLVNAVMHKGIINQHQLTDSFFDLLRSQTEEVNVAALKHIYSYKWPIYDACSRLQLVQNWLLKTPKLLEKRSDLVDIMEVRRLVITPTKAYCLLPEVELSNRVLRHYRRVADRFLRVTFMDDGMRTLNSSVITYYPASIVMDMTSNSNPQKTAIFRRFKNILHNGFHLCGRKYSFLAYSSNQLRGCSAWFFADHSKLSVANIKAWMGKFTNRNVAKCAARMGQCFSSTYATIEVLPNEVDYQLPDIKRNTYDFSDGIGLISADLAAEVAQRLQLKESPPCAYQIRFAGGKGVVAIWPTKNDQIRLSLRPSMMKFESNHSILEICSWTRFQPGFLNRQIILLLSTLKVDDGIFWKMQEVMISKLDQMLVDKDVAFDVLTASCAEHGNTAAIMLSAGFDTKTEPHLRGMLTSIRAAQLEDLREKARIFVPSGRWLMGCLDELGILEQGQCFIQVSNPSLENQFAKHGARFSETQKNLQVIKGFVAVTKNPCLHPGDVRILEAVDVPGLHHLFDCLVFPQKGDRPHTNEISGSDLDGDLYFVTWDVNLIPPTKESWTPMDYASPKVKELPREVIHSEIIDFFAKNMVNESLGAICNAHVVHADLSEDGALDENCIKLAELAATAVDFPKTGKVATLPSRLKPKLYPDFMGKEDFQSYKSNKILGRLYRYVKDACDKDMEKSPEELFLPEHIPYDTDLEISGSTAFVIEAWDHKCAYDGQLNGLLGQYKVNSEEELVTAHIWSLPKYGTKKQGELKERLKHAYNALKKEFRKAFEHMGSDFDQLCDDEKSNMYEKKASAWYQVTYRPEWVKKSLELQNPDGQGEIVMLSFAWIAADYLARIKIRQRGVPSAGDLGKPINSLGRYLSDRI